MSEKLSQLDVSEKNDSSDHNDNKQNETPAGGQATLPEDNKSKVLGIDTCWHTQIYLIDVLTLFVSVKL